MNSHMSTGPLPRGAESRVCLLVAAFFPSVELPALGYFYGEFFMLLLLIALLSVLTMSISSDIRGWGV